MKVVIFLLTVVISISAYSKNKVGKLEIGDQAVLTDVKMEDISGEKVSLEDAKMENGLLLMFSCNTCPFVLKWEDRYHELKKLADKNNVGMVLLNSNHQKHQSSESLEAMAAHAKEQNYNFYYLLDKESAIANAYGGQTTPHVFLFDSNMKLVYKGAIDDNYKSADKVEEASPFLAQR